MDGLEIGGARTSRFSRGREADELTGTRSKLGRRRREGEHWRTEETLGPALAYYSTQNVVCTL